MNTNNQTSRSLAATKKVFARPANLHLAWSTSKGVASPLHGSSSASYASSSQQKSAVPPTIYCFGTPALLHPYNAPALPSHSEVDTDASPRFSASVIDVERPLRRSGSRSSGVVLKAGHLTWRGSDDTSSKKTALGGFERALRRRQASRDLVTDKDQDVFVTLEQSDLDGRQGSARGSVSKSLSQPSFSTGPFLASPGAHDPTAFDNDSLLSFRSRTVPSGLPGKNGWVPPPSWGVLDTPSARHDSPWSSPTSTFSDPLQTPRCSQPSSSRESGIFLNLYSQDSAKVRSSSNASLQMCLRITRQSTVEMQTCPSQSPSSDGSIPLRRKQLVITGEPADITPAQTSIPYFTASARSQSSDELASRRPSNIVCILSSANVAELTEWLHSIESAIQQCRNSFAEAFNPRCSSGSILDTLGLFDQLQIRRATDCWGEDKNHHSTPMAISRSLPSHDRSPSSPQFIHPSYNESDSAFSTSAFIDYYIVRPDSPIIDDEPAHVAVSDALYSFEDAYASIMRRFAENDLASPPSSLPTASLQAYVGHAQSEDLDVSVSPRSFAFDQDPWAIQEAPPSSPLDPWLSQTAARSATSLFNSAFGDDTVVNDIFRKGFARRRSSSLSGL